MKTANNLILAIGGTATSAAAWLITNANAVFAFWAGLAGALVATFAAVRGYIEMRKAWRDRNK